MSSQRPMICAACRRVLDRHTDRLTLAVTYHHTAQDETGHEPRPIPMPDGFTEGRCDFCNTLGSITHVLPADDFEVPDRPGSNSDGDWGACVTCADLIRLDNWDGLARRVTKLVGQKHGTIVAIAAFPGIVELYRVLRKHITGPIRPIA